MKRAASVLFAALALCRLAGAQGAKSWEEGLFPPPMDRLYENRLEAESAEFLSLNLFNVSLDPKRLAEPAHFAVTSPDDPDYAAAKTVHPLASGSRTRVVRAAMRKDLLVHGTCIFLRLPRPLKNGKSYRVAATGFSLPELAPVRFDDARQINDNLRVDQVGYLPDYPKRAYLGQYLGDLGSMTCTARTFELLDAAGKPAYSGVVKPRGVADELVGQTVYELDFSPFKKPGRYRVRVPGIGLSHPFEIGERALDPAFLNLMRGNLHQRCGMEITPEYSRHARPACHLDDALRDAAAEKTPFVQAKHALYATRYGGERQPAIHGHHDAGDYGKYTITGAAYVFNILNALEAFPGKLRQDHLGLPYSGNAIPDLVEECKWELDWLERMQDPDDGGVFGVIKPSSGGYEHFLPPKEGKRLFFPKDTVFTAAYAAALAHASRSPELRLHYPKETARYLVQARRAWEFLEKHDTYVEYFHYGKEFGDWDERCWAAVELYAATGEERFHRYFLKEFDPGRARWGWWPLFEGVGYATNAYLFLKDKPTDPAMLARCREALHTACKLHLDDAAAFPYRLSMPRETIRHGNYGWVFPGDLAGYDLLMGYAVEGDRRYLECALDNLHYTLGANPSGYSLQTGLGAKRNMEAVSDASSWDEIIEPLPGLPLGIGSGEPYWLNQYGKRIGEGAYPAQWPLMNRWYDGFNVSTEFTMGPMIRETVVAAYFSGSDARPAKAPRLKIQVAQAAGPAPHRVRLDVTSDQPDSFRQVFWDFGDESFSAQKSPVHVFRDPGRHYPIAVSVITEAGLSAYATAEIDALPVNPSYPREEWKPDERTLLLYHLNGDLKDAAGHGAELRAEAKRAGERRSYTFTAYTPAWMAKPTGSSLALDGAEQLSVVVPRELLPDPASTPLTLEMMVYVREFAGWSYPGDPVVLGLRNEWDSMLGWQQETWDRGEAPRFLKTIPSTRFAREFPRDRWCHVKLTYDGQGKARFLVDGQVWGSSEGPVFRGGLKTPLVLTIGPFRGMVDEVRLRRGGD